LTLPLHAGLALARRISEGDIRLMTLLAGSSSAVERIGSGCAVFAGTASPLTHACGLGLAGPVSDAEIERMEEFFFSQGANSSVEVNPLADASLREALDRRGYRLAEFENVLVRAADLRPAAASSPPSIQVSRCLPQQQDLWALLTARGFFDRDEVTAAELAIGSVLFYASQCFLASVDGIPAGSAAMAIFSGAAHFFADSTVPAMRGRGVQAALIRERLRDAGGRGCDLVTACTAPGTQSQRNYERLGFQVAYTKAGMWRERPR
jgi:ribosomal protein S18 acetylase RimI-like enzyme